MNDIDLGKISFKSYTPKYDECFDVYGKQEYVSFAKWDSNLIFYDDEFAGFIKVYVRDYERNDREIQIALIPKYRGKGLATCVITSFVNNLFKANSSCEAVHLAIDKRNIPSIKMAINCGFVENEDLERELREDGDEFTLVFTVKNMNYGSNDEETAKRF